MKDMWWTKHRPKTLEDYIFTDESTKGWIEKSIEDQTIPHLLLHGRPGTGKTALAYLLKEQLNIDDIDFMFVDGSTQTSVDVIRNDVLSFVSTFALNQFKIVFIDEADRLSKAAFDALKSMVVEYADNARFILACNRVHKIPLDLQSRFTPIKFDKIDTDELTMKAYTILKAEKVKVPGVEILDEYIKAARHDFRKLLVMLQRFTVDGVLQPVSTGAEENFEIKAEAMLQMGNGDWDAARTLLCDKLDDDEFGEMYSFLYSNLNELDKFTDQKKWKAGIVIISDYLFRHETVADKEINFAACMIKLSEV